MLENLSAKYSAGGITIKLQPLTIEPNRHIGWWTIKDRLISEKIEIEILKSNETHKKTDDIKETWMRLFFIAAQADSELPKGLVCVTYLKTDWLDGAIATIKPSLSWGIWNLEFIPRSTKMGQTHSVYGSPRPRTEAEQANPEKIQAFLAKYGKKLKD